jgi:hypothetical protein
LSHEGSSELQMLEERWRKAFNSGSAFPAKDARSLNAGEGAHQISA